MNKTTIASFSEVFTAGQFLSPSTI